MRRKIAGAVVALGGIAVLSAAMVPLRTHLSLATPALVLVAPVVAGVAIGGLASGLVAVAAGFVAYDVLFIPPYQTLTVGAGQNWAALGVYAVVMLIVARVVGFLQEARAVARRHEESTRRLYQLSDLLIGDQPVAGVLQAIAATIHELFAARWVAVLLPEEPGLHVGLPAPAPARAAAPLRVAATAGEPLTEDELRDLRPAPGRTEHLRWAGGHEVVTRLALTARARPIGMVAMAGPPLDAHGTELLSTYANQAALALERSQLREQALQSELLEEVDRLRAAMMGAVSHDLRTPLASIKTAVSALRAPPAASHRSLGEELSETGPTPADGSSGEGLSDADRDELLGLVEQQADALDRLVANLLDMTRIQAGALEVRRAIVPVAELVEGALLATAVPRPRVALDLPEEVPPVLVDQVLMERVLANLLDNAVRHSPDGQLVEVGASLRGRGDTATVELAVTDHGPGIPPAERERVFQMFNRSAGGGRAGLGLAIARAFAEAHGQTVRVEEAHGGGARFVVTLAVAVVPADAA